jgi:nitrogen PTS system EIIA component
LETPPELFPEPSDDADLGIGDALQEGGVFHDVAGTDKSGALAAAVRTVHVPDGFDRDFLLGVLLAREGLGSTAIGDGIAIPHPRHPIVLPVSRPLVSLCFLATPVEFGAPDGKPTHALFLVISPTVRLHLHLLSRLTFALNDAGFKAAVERHAPASEIIAQARRVDALVEQR